MTNQTVGEALGQWLTKHSIGRKPRSVDFNEEIASIVRAQWPGPLEAAPASVSAEQVMEFAGRVAHYCPSRWNALVSAVRFVSPEGRALPRRRLRAKERPVISQGEFKRVLEECDRLPKSRAGLVVRFLIHTGLRITEARLLRWADVQDDCLRVPGSVTKSGLPRAVPFINGIRDTLERLRALGGDFVLPRPAVRMGIYKACAQAGVPRLSHHDFRHLFATRCVQSGVDLPTVARWLGHQDGGALLARLYFHLVDEHSRKMAGRVVI